MPSDPTPSIFGPVVGAILGGIFGFLIAYFNFKLQQKKKIIECDVAAVRLLRFQPRVEAPISMSVDKFRLTGNLEDKGHLVQIQNAYGYEIILANTGNEPIENPVIDIE